MDWIDWDRVIYVVIVCFVFYVGIRMMIYVSDKLNNIESLLKEIRDHTKK